MKRLVVSLGLVLVLAGNAFAQKSDQGTKPLDIQKTAHKKYLELKDAMRNLSDLLAKSEKDKSKRIKLGLSLLSESGVDSKMEEIEELLGDKEWQQAMSKIGEIRKELDRLLQLLMDRDRDLAKLLERIKQLEDYVKTLDEIIKEQDDEKDASAQAEAERKHLENIKAARKRVEELIKEQKAIKASTESKGAGKKDSKDLAAKQEDVKEATDELKRDFDALAEEARELRAAAQKAAEGEGEGSEGEGSEGKGSEGKGSEGKSSASKSAASAAKSMAQSAAKLGNNAPESSLDDQEQAIEDLEQAADDLKQMEEEQQAKLEEIPFEALAQKQHATAAKTTDLAEEMEKAELGDGTEEGAGEAVPGRKNIEQAVPKQKNAAGSLQKMKPAKAKEKQKDARDDLDEARKKLEDALAQLRQELQDEVLRALEEIFTGMLAQQKELSNRTILLNKHRASTGGMFVTGRVPESIRNRSEKIGEGESALANEAKSALRLLKEEGSSAVFPEIVADLVEDLNNVAVNLENAETGDETQATQAIIEETLAALIEALTDEIESKDGEDGEP